MMSANTSQTCILIVEDDKDFRESISSILRSPQYQILEAENGQQALDILKQNPKIRLICSDIRMPVMSGIDLFEKVKGRKIPFIMMTGFSELIDAQKATEMGVNEFISKPFTREDLLSAIELCLHEKGATDSTGKKNIDQEYCRVHIDDFIMGSKVASDVFIRLSESKYLMIARSSNPLSRDRLESFKKKGLEYLFIPKANFAAYVGFNLNLAKVALNRRVGLSAEQKLHLFKHTSEVLLEDAFINGVNREAYASGKSVMESTVQILSESDDIFVLMEMLKNNSDVIYAHSLGVGVYACLIAKRLGWNSQSTLFKISMAGLFHDIGKKEIPKVILEKSRMELTSEEVKVYETHTVRGKDILSSIPGIPEEVVFASIQHHESMSGTGFPYQLPRARIQPISRLIALSNEFCNLVLKGNGATQVLSAHEALNRIYAYKKENFDLSFLKALMELFDYPIPDDLKKVRKFKDVA